MDDETSQRGAGTGRQGDPGRYAFDATQWTVVVSPAKEDSDEGRRALSKLCEIYWFPIYAFVRKRGHPPDRAEDLTQEFFAQMLEKGNIGRADRSRGKFRSFLMTSVENFLRDDHEKQSAQKRGGGRTVLSLDAEVGESLYQKIPEGRAKSPEQLFDRTWANSLLQRVLNRVRFEAKQSGKGAFFGRIEPHLWGDSDSVPYAKIGEEHGMTVPAVKVNAYRMRQRFRDVLRGEIAATVDSAADIDEEIGYLIACFAAD